MSLTRAALDDLAREADRAALKRAELDKLDLSKPWAVGNMAYEVKDFGVEAGKLCVRLAVKKDDRRHFIGKPDTTIETIRIASPRTKIPTGRMLKDRDGNVYAEMTTDPVAALKFALSRRANRLIGDLIPDGLPEKIGRTDDLFYSAAGDTDAAGIDGFIRKGRTAGFTWAEAQSADTTNVGAFATQTSWSHIAGILANDVSANWCDTNNGHERSFYAMETGATLSGRSVTAASLTIRGKAQVDDLSITPKLYLANADSWAGTSLAVTDKELWTKTAIAELAWASFNAAGDNVFTITDFSAISTSGLTKLALVLQHILENTEPTYILGARTSVGGYFADDATYDPELAVSSELAPAFASGMGAHIARGMVPGLRI